MDSTVHTIQQNAPQQVAPVWAQGLFQDMQQVQQQIQQVQQVVQQVQQQVQQVGQDVQALSHYTVVTRLHSLSADACATARNVNGHAFTVTSLLQALPRPPDLPAGYRLEDPLPALEMPNDFPGTMEALRALTSPQLQNLLQWYRQPIPPNLDGRRLAFYQFIGVSS